MEEGAVNGTRNAGAVGCACAPAALLLRVLLQCLQRCTVVDVPLLPAQHEHKYKCGTFEGTFEPTRSLSNEVIAW